MLNRKSTLNDGMVLDALLYAHELHKGQVRKGSNLPYISHPVAVSYLVAQYKRSKHLADLITAALLHDLVEDTTATLVDIEKRFSPMVAGLVHELTSDRNEIERLGKLAYLQQKFLKLSKYALVIKLADRLHNVSDQPTEQTLADTLILMNYLEQHRELTRTQEQLVDQIVKTCFRKQSPQVDA